MSKASTQTNSRKGIKISDRTRKLYDERVKRADATDETRPLSPDVWANAMRRDEFFKPRPTKMQITARIDSDVLAWLKGEDERGYQVRMNAILRRVMELSEGDNTAR